MLRLLASPPALRTTLRARDTRARRALLLGVALSALLTPSTAVAQPAPMRQPPAQVGAAPAQPGIAPAQPGIAPAQPGGVAPAQPGVAPAPPGIAPGQPGAAPALPGAAPVQPGYPPPGYYGGYPPYGGGYYPPPGYYYYYPSPQQAPPPPAPVPLKRKSEGMMYGGMALTGGGVVGFIVGSILLATANDRYEIYCDYGGYTSICEKRDDEPRMAAGTAITVVGGLMMAVGIPLWVIGAKKVPIKPSDEAPKTARRPTLSVGATSATLHVPF